MQLRELALSLAMNLLRNVSYTANKTKDRNFTVDKQMFSKVRNCTVPGCCWIRKNWNDSLQNFQRIRSKYVIGYDLFLKQGRRYCNTSFYG